MKFIPLKLNDAYKIEIEPIHDDRGFFARSFCQRSFEDLQLKTTIIQSNISYNRKKGTVRGMHYQVKPHEEAKLVRCVKGTIYDVIIDIRPDSTTFKQWFGIKLSEHNNTMLYIPEGFAHGFQTLEDNVKVSYQMFDRYSPECARGICWNDPIFKISLPLPVSTISEKDKSYRQFE